MNKIVNGLSIVSTPIGNLDDITYRAVTILKECDVIICENPKHSLKLLNKLGIKKKLIALHDYNEHKIIKQIMTIDKTLIFYILSKIYCPIIIYIIPSFSSLSRPPMSFCCWLKTLKILQASGSPSA